MLFDQSEVALELKDIKQMYEIYEVDTGKVSIALAGAASTSIDTINALSVNDISDSRYRFKNEAVVYNENSHESEDYILFVHGWRMKPYEKTFFAETAYKRLWWNGYKGRFGVYHWPTEWVERWDWFDFTDKNRLR